MMGYTASGGQLARNKRCRYGTLLIAVAIAILLTGCDDDGIQTYQVPKDKPYVQPKLPLTLDMPSQSSTSDITWAVPESWAGIPNNSGIVAAEFVAKGEAGDARITATRLSNDGGGELANINRWRGQVGLPSIEKIEDQPMTVVQVGDSPAGMMDLVAPQDAQVNMERMIAVILPRPNENLSWYFKMTGPTKTLDEQKQTFVKFVESVRFEGTPSE